MNANFNRLKDRSEHIVANSKRLGKKRAMAVLLDAWAKLEGEGIAAFDFAHAAAILAEGAMITYDTLEETKAFGEHLQSRGTSIIRCVSNHWPPVDPDAWPEKPPHWLS